MEAMEPPAEHVSRRMRVLHAMCSRVVWMADQLRNEFKWTACGLALGK